MKKLTLELIKQLPKVELHCHLDGSLRIDTIIDLAKKDPYPEIHNPAISGFINKTQLQLVINDLPDEFKQLSPILKSARARHKRDREFYVNKTEAIRDYPEISPELFDRYIQTFLNKNQ